MFLNARYRLDILKFDCSMSSWDVARLTANLGDYNIKSKADVKHLERKIKRVVRHKGFDQRTLVSKSLDISYRL